jgi:hypothetical protein
VNHCGEAGVGFVVPRGDPSELFEFAEEGFDQMAPAIHVEVARDSPHRRASFRRFPLESPAAIGVQEGVFMIIGGLLGLSPELSLALALTRRARDLIVFLPGLLAWQAQEGRRLLATA